MVRCNPRKVVSSQLLTVFSAVCLADDDGVVVLDGLAGAAGLGLAVTVGILARGLCLAIAHHSLWLYGGQKKCEQRLKQGFR